MKDNSIMTQEQLDQEMRAVYAQMTQEEKEISEHNARLVESFGEGAIEDYASLVDVLCIDQKIEPVYGPKGSRQEDDDIGVFTQVHVEQRAYGLEGDSYEGFIYAKVHNKWYRIPYSC